MVGFPRAISQFFSSLTGRLIVGILLIHVITLPFVFIGILYIVGQSNSNLFLDQTRISGRMLADKLQTKDPVSDREEIIQILDSALLSGQVVFAEVQNQGSIPAREKCKAIEN